jgi:hypothetical protein
MGPGAIAARASSAASVGTRGLLDMLVFPSTLTFVQCMPIAIDADKTAGAADNFRTGITVA